MFVHITTKRNNVEIHHHTHAILRWLLRNNVPVQHYDNCSFIDGLTKKQNGRFDNIIDIVDYFQQREDIIHSMTATMKPFASELSDCVIDRFLFLGSDVLPKPVRKQQRKQLIAPLPTTTIKTVAMFNKHTEFMQDVCQHIEFNKSRFQATNSMLLSFDKKSSN